MQYYFLICSIEAGFNKQLYVIKNLEVTVIIEFVDF